MKLPKLTAVDSRGNESTTLFFVRVTWAVMVIKFLIAGMTLPGVGLMPDINVQDFGVAAGAILAIWVGREWKDKDREQVNDNAE